MFLGKNPAGGGWVADGVAQGAGGQIRPGRHEEEAALAGEFNDAAAPGAYPGNGTEQLGPGEGVAGDQSRYPLLDYITLYIPAEFGFIEIESGDMLPFKNMPIDYYNFASRITSPPGESSIYLKIKSEGSLIFKFRGWDYDSFLHNIYVDMSRLWLLYGIIIALFFYNSFIYIVSKDKAYLFLSLFIVSTMLLTLIFNGMARKYLWPDSTWWANYSHPFALYLTLIFLIKFTQAFLNTKVYIRFTHNVLNIIVAAIIPLIMISLFTPYNISTKLSVTAMIVTPFILIIFTMIPMFWVNRKMALYYLCSWLFFSLGIILIGLIRQVFHPRRRRLRGRDPTRPAGATRRLRARRTGSIARRGGGQRSTS